MVPSSLRKYLRRQRFSLKVFRCGQWLYTTGLLCAPGVVCMMMVMSVGAAAFLHFDRACYVIGIVALSYMFLCAVLIFPKSVDRCVERMRVCHKMFVRKVLLILACCMEAEPTVKLRDVVECSELGLTQEEIEVMREVLGSSKILKEVVYN